MSLFSGLNGVGCGRRDWSLIDVRNDRWFAGLVVVAGALAGIGLWLLTTIVSRSHISGNGWSLTGNSAP